MPALTPAIFTGEDSITGPIAASTGTDCSPGPAPVHPLTTGSAVKPKSLLAQPGAVPVLEFIVFFELFVLLIRIFYIFQNRYS
jgi:hypothetical protein